MPEQIKVWVRYVANDKDPAGKVKCLLVNQASDSNIVKNNILLLFRVKVVKEHAIVKLRNHRGSLVVISEKLTSNSKLHPHVLEVIEPHENVIPISPRREPTTDQEHALVTEIRDLQRRVGEIEKTTQTNNYMENRKKNVEKQLHEIEKRLTFISNRVYETVPLDWKGMFHVSPLW